MRLNNFGAGGEEEYLHETSPDDVPRGRDDNACTTFGRPAPKISEGQKNVQIMARFLTTFDFDRKYLLNGLTYRTSEKNLISHNPFHVGQKNLGELWPTNKKVLLAHTDQPT